MLRVRWHDFELPNRIVVHDRSRTYAKFVVEPFEPGFGTTLGNTLRRTLYSSIEGVAAVGAKIQGVSHPYATLEGVREDVLDILLNLKSLVVRFNGDLEEKVLRIRGDKKGEIRADRIPEEPGVEIINKDLLICTLVDNVEFEADVWVRRGRRYQTSEETAKTFKEAGILPLDANFSPVRRVKYAVEGCRVGRRTNYERLVLEVTTNGAVTPEEALSESSRILRKHLNPFLSQFEPGREMPSLEKSVEEPSQQKEKRLEDLRAKLQLSIGELDLGVRAYHVLNQEKIETIGDLVTKQEGDLLKLKNFGKTTLKEVKKKLSEHGLSLGMRVEDIFGSRTTVGS